MLPPDGQWVDEDAGPVVRPYALTRGMTRPPGERFDVLDLVCAVQGAVSPTTGYDASELGPEQRDLLRRCQVPVPAAELAADLDLALGVVQILVGDLRERGLVTIHQARVAGQSDAKLLRDVAEGLRRI